MQYRSWSPAQAWRLTECFSGIRFSLALTNAPPSRREPFQLKRGFRNMSASQAVLLSQTGRLNREQLALVPTPPATATHRPIPHVEVIGALVDTLGLRHIAPVRE